MNRKPLMKNLYWMISLLFSFSILIAACSESKPKLTCAEQLDNEKYEEVAKNSSCSYYERGSAYLGLAGFSFSNLTKSGVWNNFSSALGITKDWQDTQLPKYRRSLCLVGGPSYVNTQCTETESRSNLSRLNKEVEISFFASLGNLILRTYGNMDLNRDGKIKANEQKIFTGYKSESSAFNFGVTANEINTFQLITNAGNYLYRNGTCYQTNTSYTGVLPKATATCPTAGDVTEVFGIAPIKVASGGVIAVIQFLNDYTLSLAGLNDDLKTLKISKKSAIQTVLNKSIAKMDNGAKKDNSNCDEEPSSLALRTLVSTLASIIARSNDENLRTKNLIPYTTLGVSSSSINFPSEYTTLNKVNVRMIYRKNNSRYTDRCESNKGSDICNSLLAMDEFVKDSTKGDNKITYGELTCLSKFL